MNTETQQIESKPKQRQRKNIRHYELNAKELSEYLDIDIESLKEIQFYNPLSIKQELFLNDQENDIIVYGGQAASGKSQVSILRMLIGAITDPHYTATICRQSKVQLKGSGAIFPTASKVFEEAGKASTNRVELSWSFPSGVDIKALHLWDNQNDYQGQQNTEYYVDEAVQCKEEDITYLLTRLRSKSKRTHQLILATNPLYESFLRVWLERAGYLDEDGYPNKAMDGKTVYMLRQDGEWMFKNTWEELADLYGADSADEAYRFVFYSAGVDDNPYIRRYLPSYIRKLDNLPRRDKEMLRLGCWHSKLEASGFFKREWVKIIDYADVPRHLRFIRAYDLASTLPDKEVNKNPDYSRGILGGYDRDTGIFYVCDMVSLRDRPARVQQMIEATAQKDGKNVYVCLAKDPGSAAEEALQNKRARLGRLGFKTLVSKTRGSKLERAEGFLIAAQNMQVCLVRGDWNRPFLEELENFTGKTNNKEKNDIVDATSDCFNQCTNSSLIPSITFNKARAGLMRGNTLI